MTQSGIETATFGLNQLRYRVASSTQENIKILQPPASTVVTSSTNVIKLYNLLNYEAEHVCEHANVVLRSNRIH
jgi:hypothetical protein